MLISKYLPPQRVLLNLSVADKWELIERLLDSAAESLPGELRRSARDVILQREREHSTGLGDGLAIPHGRVTDLDRLVLVLGVVPEGVEYGTLDGRPVQIAMLVLAPEANPTLGLQVMSSVAGLFAEGGAREAFLEAQSPQQLHDYIERHQWSADAPILARDVMRPMLTRIRPDMPLREVTRVMHEARVDAVAVLDEDGRIVGEIAADHLFKHGVPDFFNQLASVSFIRDFNPFEKYFEQEADAVAADIMAPPAGVVDETATIMEVVYLLSVRNCPKVHVTRDGRKVGTIERATLLDRILNL